MRMALLTSLLVLALLVWLFCPLQPAVVSGSSMEPTLHNRQLVLIDRSAYQHSLPVDGDIVVFRQGGEVLIKRIRATAGEMVDFGPRVVRNGRRPVDVLPHSYLRIPPECIFVEGDSPFSYDSNEFGPVPMDSVLGKMIVPSPPPPATRG